MTGTIVLSAQIVFTDSLVLGHREEIIVRALYNNTLDSTQ